MCQMPPVEPAVLAFPLKVATLKIVMMDGPVIVTNTLQRSRGEADVAFRNNNLDRLYQRGAAKALLPQSYCSSHEVVLVNTAGGITGGDKFDYSCRVDASKVVVTTQAAERAYCSSAEEKARMNVRLGAANGGVIHWLPQETILFDGCTFGRRIDVDLDQTSECLILESLVFGRHAMGEELRSCHFTDSWRIRQNDRLLHAEGLSLHDDVPGLLKAHSAAGTAQMAATLVYVGPRLDQLQADIVSVIPSLTSRVATSAFQGRLVLRLLAAETMAGKTDLRRILSSIRGQQVPRVWQS